MTTTLYGQPVKGLGTEIGGERRTYYFTKSREGMGDVEIELWFFPEGSRLGSGVGLRYTDEALEGRIDQEKERADEAIEATLADSVKDVL